MPEFPKDYKSRSFKIGGPDGEIVTKMVLHDGTVLNENAEPISGPGFQAKKAPSSPKPKPKPQPKPSRDSMSRAARAAERFELREEDDD